MKTVRHAEMYHGERRVVSATSEYHVTITLYGCYSDVLRVIIWLLYGRYLDVTHEEY